MHSRFGHLFSLVALTLFLWARVQAEALPLETVQSAGTAAPTNVILITVDTLRADYVSAYGKRPGLTPALDSLASDGVLFENAYCQVPLTPPSHASILTGTYPATHGLRDFTSGRMHPEIPTAASMLQPMGYQTGAFVSAFVLDRSWGMSAGFDLYFDEFETAAFSETNPGNVQRPARETVDRVLEWLNTAREPYLLWVHLFDPHHDYNPPEPYRTRHARDLYAGEVAYADHEIGRLLQALKDRKQYGRSLIVATSDHGESLGEHEEQEHGFFLYEAAVRVPLIFKLPDSYGVRGRSVESLAQTVDIVPTVLQVLRLPSGTAPGVEGRGLLSVILGKRQEAGFAYAETRYPLTTFGWSPLRLYREGDHKFIEAPRAELYQLPEDPEEQHNLVKNQSALAHQLREKLLALEARFSPTGSVPFSSTPTGSVPYSPDSPPPKAPAPKGSVPYSPNPKPQGSVPNSRDSLEREERLRSLGYIAVAQAKVATDISRLADPKDRVGTYNRVLEGLQAAEAGQLQLSNAILEGVAEQSPELFIVHHQIGSNYLKLAQPQAALDALRRALELNPAFVSTNVAAAQCLAQLGRPDEGIELLERLHRETGPTLSSRRQLALLYGRRQRHRDAIVIYEDILKERPGDRQALKMLGIAQVEAQDYAAGLARLDQVAQTGERDALVENHRGIALANLGRMEEGVQAYRSAIALNPGYPQPRLNLALTLLREGRKEEALEEFEGLCRISQAMCERYRERFR